LDSKASTIISCEPNLYCVDTIKKYYGQNSNLTFNQYAISDKNGKTLLQIGRNSEKTGGGKILGAKANSPDYYVDGKIIEVDTITFKDFTKKNKIGQIDFLKVDCEGSEVFIFIEENAEFFRMNVDKIALEFHNEKKDDITKFLSDAGYEVHVDNGKDNLGMLYAKNTNFKKAVFAVLST
jgi:FkbM family methyltransferase